MNREPWWAWLLALLLNLLTGRAKDEGRAEVAQEQKEQADALRKDYVEIGADDRDFPTAVDRLRARAARARPTADHGSGGGVP